MSDRMPAIPPLPNVTNVAFALVDYLPPREVPVNGTLVTYSDAVEILVETDGPIPPLGRSAVLLLGNSIVTDVRALDVNLFAFVAYEYRTFTTGAPLSLVWDQPSGEIVTTSFTYQPPPPV